ncbi:cytochrome o ubiquinol oxidase subunit III [Bordetella hinzii]|uniref:Cytochrome bo(3) ubiquinol oxidase subunit 3 n=1 Tax=Bordetella hinzii OH87 BAL007II TaxID=1331262 RepID=A0ABR4R856_9BORD|nr:cytochrome o ubiquinol oxidase subunit III [Bordetella hinzii]AKQ54624.1 Cytochrome bo(3) ubiquinol oxidase subunit 3 [Bordetella hinzii]KCB24427.1 cytochrome o ubiquinol oxidase, subunit III [Bordetella hinzii L60]KCB26593.1 cytochrome o ubiquinol oxidase, subunit III [Bordetella hinzii OH87 BAL007II]KCB34391.1 cytochrome o ubiquinol oxidase, subunit III [Bordetella hinzii CA90 BAL1384]KCB41003.1 cytochrome o ubiquinol oxidase, subunit III [Bordetella hinzii 5132]
MTHAVATHSHEAHHGHHDDGSKTVFGFWVYLMSDLLIFSVLFATFAVLSNATAGGPHGRDLFDLKFVLVETMLLLISSFTFGVAMLNMYAGKANKVIAWLLITFLFGAGFIAMELYEFQHLIHEGAGPGRSAYLSAFFFLIGTHGLHVTAGLLWIIIMVDMVRRHGLDGVNKRRLACLSLFWHFLDIVWICVFTFVYLMGAI